MTDRESPRGATARITVEVVAFCTLSLLGGGLFALVALTEIDWFYPTLFYVAVVYVAAQRYFYIGNGSPELDLEYERAQDTTMQTYLDQMTELLLKEGLRENLLKIRDAEPIDNVDVVLLAQAQTFTVLQRLDGERKRGVVMFLYKSSLIRGRHPPLNHHRADLQSANLDGLSLPDVGLPGANLREADLRGSDLSGADLSGADLSGADLSRTDLSGANLHGANLYWTKGITEEELEKQAKSIEGATMPDGWKHA